MTVVVPPGPAAEDGPRIGDTVEWDMAVAPWTRRAVVDRVDPTGRVYVRFTYVNHRGPRRTRVGECWFDAHERHLMRLVERARLPEVRPPVRPAPGGDS